MLNGQCDNEAGAGVIGGVKGDGASKLFGKFTTQGESETDALLEGVEFDEASEDVLRLFSGYAAARILDSDGKGVGKGRWLDDNAALFGVFSVSFVSFVKTSGTDTLAGSVLSTGFI